ncbi:MAG TPA: hypothetical protein P5552_18000 [Candidatus Competibacteraceae bacterium]|nr:hypothetical protein [Candidatus Competibacteraceae bacterium]
MRIQIDQENAQTIQCAAVGKVRSGRGLGRTTLKKSDGATNGSTADWAQLTDTEQVAVTIDALQIVGALTPLVFRRNAQRGYAGASFGFQPSNVLRAETQHSCRFPDRKPPQRLIEMGLRSDTAQFFKKMATGPGEVLQEDGGFVDIYGHG